MKKLIFILAFVLLTWCGTSWAINITENELNDSNQYIYTYTLSTDSDNYYQSNALAQSTTTCTNIAYSSSSGGYLYAPNSPYSGELEWEWVLPSGWRVAKMEVYYRMTLWDRDANDWCKTWIVPDTSLYEDAYTDASIAASSPYDEGVIDYCLAGYTDASTYVLGSEEVYFKWLTNSHQVNQPQFCRGLGSFIIRITCTDEVPSPEREYYTPTDPCNVLDNSSFEDSSDTSAAFWAKNTASGTYEYSVTGNAHTGSSCLAITGTQAGAARWYTSDVYLVEGAKYKMRCWVKTDGNDVTGRVWIPELVDCYFTEDCSTWTVLDANFISNHTGLTTIFLANYGVDKTFFDDISIKMIEQPLQDAILTYSEPLTHIIIPGNCTVTDYSSALEAQRVLLKMTGIQLDIIPEPLSSSGTGCIYINCAPDINDYTTDLTSIGDEGIVLDIDWDNIVCLGNTSRGVYYAVQELLYQLGCRWYTPWDGGECIPEVSSIPAPLSYQKMSALALPYQKIVHDPSFELRGNSTPWTYAYPPNMTTTTVDTGWIEYAARNRMNALTGNSTNAWDYGAIYGHSAQDKAGHNIQTIIDPCTYFDDHPEYFPEVNYPTGTVARTYVTPWATGRRANVCVSDVNVIQICADAAVEYFDTHPFAERFHIGQMDLGAHCECSSCKALDPSGSVEWSKKHNDEVLLFTDRWMWFINQIADEVADTYPSKTISTYAYAETLTVPIDANNDPCDNVMIELTWSYTNLQDLNDWNAARCFKHDLDDATCPNNVDGNDILTDWLNLADVSNYTYYLYYNNTGTAGSYCHNDAAFYSSTHDKGVRYTNDEVGTDPLSAPLLLNLRSRVIWDVNTDVNDYIDDFCSSVYGVAAVPVKDYFTSLEEIVSKSTESHVHFNDFDLFTASDINDLNDYLDTAESNAGTDTTLLGRIARLRLSTIYTEIKTLDDVNDANEIDILQADANDLVQKYNIPVRDTVWNVLKP